jgi:hypothetical protein
VTQTRFAQTFTPQNLAAQYLARISLSSIVVTLPAIGADTVNLKGVASGQILVLTPDLLFDLSDLRRKKLYRRAAFRTHHVVMAAAVVLVLVARDAVVEGDFAGEAAISQKFERAVHGGESDARIFFPDQTVQLVGGEMLARFEESAQDDVALTSLLQSYPTQVLEEDCLGRAHALTRDAGLIVDALL